MLNASHRSLAIHKDCKSEIMPDVLQFQSQRCIVVLTLIVCDDMLTSLKAGVCVWVGVCGCKVAVTVISNIIRKHKLQLYSISLIYFKK